MEPLVYLFVLFVHLEGLERKSGVGGETAILVFVIVSEEGPNSSIIQVVELLSQRGSDLNEGNQKY